MEEKKTSLGIHSLIFGSYTGCALILCTLILYIANLYMNKGLGIIPILILIGGMIWGTLMFRKRNLNGIITYGKYFSSSFLIGIFASIISTIFFFFYVKYINTGMIDEIFTQAKNNIEAKAGNMSDEQINQAMAMTEKFMNPIAMTIIGLLSYIFFGIIISLFLGFLLQNNDEKGLRLLNIYGYVSCGIMILGVLLLWVKIGTLIGIHGIVTPGGILGIILSFIGAFLLYRRMKFSISIGVVNLIIGLCYLIGGNEMYSLFGGYISISKDDSNPQIGLYLFIFGSIIFIISLMQIFFIKGIVHPQNELEQV